MCYHAREVFLQLRETFCGIVIGCSIIVTPYSSQHFLLPVILHHQHGVVQGMAYCINHS